MLILEFLIKRIAQGLLIVFITSLIIFTLLRVVPGDPVRLIVGGMAPPDVVEKGGDENGAARSDHRAIWPLYAWPAARRPRPILPAPAQRHDSDRRTVYRSDQVGHGARDRSHSGALAIHPSIGWHGVAVCALDVISYRNCGRITSARLAECARLWRAVIVRIDSQFLACHRPDPVSVGQAQAAAGARLSGIFLCPAARVRAGGRDCTLHHPHADDVARRGDAIDLHRRSACPRTVATPHCLFTRAAQCGGPAG